MSELALNRWQYLEFEKLGLGAFEPLAGFMNEDMFHGVVDHMRLPSGDVFPLPVVLDVSRGEAKRLKGAPRVALLFEGREVGEVMPECVFSCDKATVARKLFGTDDAAHPGVHFFMSGGDAFVGGPVRLKERVPLDISRFELTPEQTRTAFAERAWRTVVGFQTRNVPHRAHEYLQRVALEHVDGLFIQPLVGRKKKGDYTPEAIMAGYSVLLDQFYPRNRVVLGILSTFMRYAGPREAVFHAIIRRNYGCTHFIVGRDHAGVGEYYGKYEAHDLTRRFEDELGIEIMRLHGPYHCARCDGIVTEHSCPHYGGDPSYVREISGTDMRAMLLGGMTPDAHLMRPEIIDSLRDVPLFIEESDV
ncbi:MAG: sulfate adenylyltransferase [Alphaproteobacteria bacterium]|nr:sulfate adenylyltransferase [Alphaproteobacteria bacterium]